MEVKEMEESTPTVWTGKITGIKFALATVDEICKASISDFPISHASQLSNSFLGLPLENGRCDSCGAAEAGQCEGHFGYIELPIPVYHPSHLSELKRLLDIVCLKCLKVKNKKVQKNIGIIERAFSSCCEEASLISVNEQRTSDGACFLLLKINKLKYREGAWNFLERFGYRYGDRHYRPLLPSEVMVILKKLPAETKKKLSAKGFFPQDGYVMQYLPVPPNCLSVPDVSDGITVMSSDLSTAKLKKILRKIEIIKTSRSGTPNFEAHEVEANDLQAAIAEYLDSRGTSKASRDIDSRFGINKDSNATTKAWLEKMKTLFIRKGSGFSSRSVITGDAYKGVAEIGLPSEIAQRITFEERVTEHNMQYLQKLVDEKLCLTYTDGQSTYSLKEGSKGHTFLRPGQVVHRRVMDGDTVFINRPPTTHKHSLQALAVYIHEDHTVKINPLICGPLSADFDGDCVHLFYPQSLAAKAEVVELFSVEKQLLCSHNSKLNLQVGTDSLLSLKLLFKNSFFPRAYVQQLAMFLSNPLPEPTLLKPQVFGEQWTASQILQTAFPQSFDCLGEKYTVRGSEILNFDLSRGTMQSSINEMLASVFQEKGPDEVLNFLNSLQPMLMENLFNEGFSIDLKDFYIPGDIIENIQNGMQKISPLLDQVRLTYNELVELQIDTELRLMKVPIADLIIGSSGMGDIIDPKSDSAITKVVQQVGFLGIQLSDRGKFYTKTLVGDMAALFRNNYPFRALYPSEEFGLVRSCLFHGLDPFQEMVHSISAREVIVRSSRGLTEPGTLFKNLMAILRDVNICYDGTVRNVCSNAIIQFQYGAKAGSSLFAAGEPVGVLAATAMSNPAYKAVLDSSSSSNSSWEMMKEILLCPATFKNVLSDRRVTLYLNDCECGREYCREKAAYAVKKHLKKVSLKDIASEFSIEYHGQQIPHEGSQGDGNLVGHVHLNKLMFQDQQVSMLEICEKVQGRIDSFLKQKGIKKKAVGHLFKRLKLSVSECCSFGTQCGADMPCLTFFWQDLTDLYLDETSQALAHLVLPVILETIIKGDPRVCTADILWIAPDTSNWIRNPSTNHNGELAVEIVIEKEAVKQSGDAWRVVMDACLPVIHLIDTTRSTPNAIKQVEQLLGISCAFEQAVQRLSKSVSMVTKGIVKEHLILLANSMTYAGGMIGFNSGGIKALSKSSNVRGPFAEATLFTPKKCFERAAEKGHFDTLSSIVASCSWGKQVAVGTGSRFDILWDTREVGKDQQEATDVYEFLHLVRSTNAEVPDSGLCADVDDIDPDYDNEEWGMSPEHGSEKPTFEDPIEFQNGLENQVGDLGNSNDNWGQKSSANAKNSEKDWGAGAATSSKSNAWSSWGNDSAAKEDSVSLAGQEKESAANSWGSSQKSEPSSGKPWGNSDGTPKPVQSTWGNDSAPKEDILAKEPAANSWGSSQKGEPSSDKAWGSGGGAQTSWKAASATPIPNVKSTWGSDSAQKEDTIEKEPVANSWGSSKKGESSSGKAWGSGGGTQTSREAVAATPKHNVQSTWGSDSAEKEDTVEKEPVANSWGSSKKGESSSGKAWGSGGGTQTSREVVAATPKQNVQSTWGSDSSEKEDTVTKEPVASSWGSSQKAEASTGQPWGSGGGSQTSWETVAATPKPNVQSNWGAKKDDYIENSTGGQIKDSAADSWGSGKRSEPASGKGWGGGDTPSLSPKPDFRSSWGSDSASKEDVGVPQTGQRNDSWGGSIQKSKGDKEWGSGGDTQPDSLSSWGAKTTQGEDEREDPWKSSQNNESGAKSAGDSWGKTNGGSGSSTRWGAKSVQRDDNIPPSSPSSQWGQPKRFNNNQKREQSDSPRGWGSSGAGEWKHKASGHVTATRQRLDMFTSDEQEIIQVIEPIMLSIRRIMHQSGYNDGDPFSVEDQSYILDNVFNFHPEKAAKMGVGIDHIMVNKHSEFQDSRCLYVVLTDGHKEDFSYRKCLENFVRTKYPDLAEDFNGKYFKKPQPRPPMNRDRSVGPPEEAAGQQEEAATEKVETQEPVVC